MKKYIAEYLFTVTYNGGINQKIIRKTIEAKSVKVAQSKAKRMEQYSGKRGYTGNLMILQNVYEG